MSNDAMFLRDAAQILHKWWARLAHDERAESDQTPLPRAYRAELRRAVSPDDAILTAGFRSLWFSLPEQHRRPADMLAWGCIAAVLADVRQDEPQYEFAASLGRESDRVRGKASVSEIRFAQLQRSADLDELQRRLRRVVALRNGRVNVVSLADGILHWHREMQGHRSARPEHRLSVRWANAYYTHLVG